MEGGVSPGDNGYEMTSALKDTEDLNDELFGALKKSSKDSKKLSALSTDDGGKKKIGFGEFDDSDPLGDISLEEPEKSTKSVINNLDKPSKSKLIADLFGLDDTENTTEQPIAEKKKSDWLGIKDSPKKSVTISDEVDKPKSQPFNNTLDPRIKKQLPEFKPSTETDKPKVTLEKEGSSVTKIFSRDDDISNLLTENKEASHEKILARRTSADKKKDITDELFGKKTDAPSGVTQYLPSSGSGRRTGFGRRRDGLSSGQLGSSTEITTTRKDDTDKNWLFGVDDNAEKKGVQSAPLPSWLGGESKPQNEPLPKSPEKNLMDKDKRIQGETTDVIVPKAKSAPILKQTKEMKQGDESVTTKPNEEGVQLKDLLSSSSVVDKNNSAILQQTESGLLAVVQMKQQKDVMAELVSRQANILRVQEQQMGQLMEQQARRQQMVEINMKQQQERINALLQALLTESGKDTFENVQNSEGINYSLSLPVLSSHHRIESSDEDDNPAEDRIKEEKLSTNVRPKRKLRRIISKLEIEIQKLEMEKATFEQRLEIQESRHNDEIKIMEKFHRHEISSWEEREEQLKQRLTDLKADYDERVTQLHDQQEKLIQQHNIRIENLQKEKMEDLKQLGEFHRLAMDQELKENALREQKIAMEERLQLTANQARLDALAKLQGQESSISCIDIIQAKGEMEGALAAAKEVRSKVEEDKQKLHQQQVNLEAEKWRLQELETELTNKQQHIEHLIKCSEAQRKEGVMALEEAKLKEKRAEERLQEAEQRLQEVALREKKMMKEKLEMTKERAILEKKRSQLDFILPNLTQSESATLGLHHKAFIDPRNLIMRLKAEKELETA
ncbi:hypothetical protein LSTR_LSTR010158 [Laodelphax striatellus]|uniref:Uncharacterized protein n=1 Tax=Laodelphax striatellus TaxID=195883 RepID=A0A482WJS1_LAOST|nr:hypothetical protein LSTR_LSTR010158 [Laodelphax striatellus]